MEFIALLSDPAAWLALLTLIALEVVLGVDNLIFIAILSNKLPEHQQQRARRIGLALALIMRIGLLMLIGWLVALQTPIFDLGLVGTPNAYGEPSFETAFSGRDIILLIGGLFLLWKATKEIHHLMEPEDDSGDLLDKTPGTADAVKATFGAVIAQIVAIDIVFSVDSILTAVGMTDHIPIMVTAVVITVGIMMIAADPLARFIEKNPTLVMLALAFLVMIGLVLIAEQDILGDRLVRRRRSRRAENFLTEASQLGAGDLVVHVEHGIGRYEGLQTIDVGGAPHDCLKLVYDGDDRLYVPVENIEVLSRYGSEDAAASLDRLGSASWQARKAKLKERIRDMADKLIKVAAERVLQTAPAIETPEELYNEFCARFPFDETDDQIGAIEDVFADLQKGTPMDRLVCGDVGFGKTEVALRAAIAAVMAGGQVAVAGGPDLKGVLRQEPGDAAAVHQRQHGLRRRRPRKLPFLLGALATFEAALHY